MRARNVKRAILLSAAIATAVVLWFVFQMPTWHPIEASKHPPLDSPLLAFPKQREGIGSLSFSPSSHLLAAPGDDHTINIWDYDTAIVKKVLRAHTDAISAVLFLQDGEKLISGSWDKTVRIWDTKNWNCTSVINRFFYSGVIGVASCKKHIIAVATSIGDEKIRVFDLSRKDILLSERSNLSSVFGDAVAFSNCSRYIVGGGRNGFARIIDLNEDFSVHEFRAHSDDISSLCFFPNSTRFATGCINDKTIRIWDAGDPKVKETFVESSEGPRTLTISPNGRYLAASSSTVLHDVGFVTVWDCHSRQILCTLNSHKGTVDALAFSLDNEFLASGGSDGVIRLWKVSDFSARMR